jgi:C-terminal processing protease CtpA/Prc
MSHKKWLSNHLNNQWRNDVASWQRLKLLWELVKDKPDDDMMKIWVKRRINELIDKYPQYLKLGEFSL